MKKQKNGATVITGNRAIKTAKKGGFRIEIEYDGEKIYLRIRFLIFSINFDITFVKELIFKKG